MIWLWIFFHPNAIHVFPLPTESSTNNSIKIPSLWEQECGCLDLVGIPGLIFYGSRGGSYGRNITADSLMRNTECRSQRKGAGQSSQIESPMSSLVMGIHGICGRQSELCSLAREKGSCNWAMEINQDR